MKYTRTLDFVIAALQAARAGKLEVAAKAFEGALKCKDLTAAIAGLESEQKAEFAKVQAANPTIASLFAEISAKKKAKKKVAGKGKPFGGKAAPPFKKKKVKASEDGGDAKDDEEDASNVDDSLDPTLDEMTAEDLLGDEGLDVGDGSDLSLEDLEDLEDDGIDEMPEATASEDEGDEDGEEDAASDDGEDDDDSEEDDSDDEPEEDAAAPAAAAQTAKVKVVAANIAALDRLKKTAPPKSKTQAGATKPVK